MLGRGTRNARSPEPGAFYLLVNNNFEIHNCPSCGSHVRLPASPKPWPWRIRNQEDLRLYIDGLDDEPVEWVLAFFLAKDLRLIAIDPAVKGDSTSCPVDYAGLICRGRQLGAAGFLMVHNHPSGRTKPSDIDIRTTQRLRRLSVELDMPLLDHFLFAGGELVRVGEWL